MVSLVLFILSDFINASCSFSLFFLISSSRALWIDILVLISESSRVLLSFTWKLYSWRTNMFDKVSFNGSDASWFIREVLYPSKGASASNGFSSIGLKSLGSLNVFACLVTCASPAIEFLLDALILPLSGSLPSSTFSSAYSRSSQLVSSTLLT